MESYQEKPPINQSEEEVIVILSKLLGEAQKVSVLASGACVYSAGSKTYCAEIDKSSCDTLKGSWTSGGKCSS